MQTFEFVLFITECMSNDPIAVFITAPTDEEATAIANALIEKHLAACVQLLPSMQSVFFWQGKIERQEEVLLIAKTTSSKFSELEREVRELHSYETPEIVAFPLTLVNKSYLSWMKANLVEEQV